MEAALTKIQGVKRAKANNKTKTAEVVFDPGKTNLQKIMKAFNQNNDGGYKVIVAKTPGSKTSNRKPKS